jgi:hypothetical protein
MEATTYPENKLGFSYVLHPLHTFNHDLCLEINHDKIKIKEGVLVKVSCIKEMLNY